MLKRVAANNSRALCMRQIMFNRVSPDAAGFSRSAEPVSVSGERQSKPVAGRSSLITAGPSTMYPEQEDVPRCKVLLRSRV